jgi:hypothetical protein
MERKSSLPPTQEPNECRPHVNYLFKIPFNITFSSILKSTKWSLTTKIVYAFLLRACYIFRLLQPPCRAIAQAVSRRLPTAAARVRAQFRSFEILVGKVVLSQVFPSTSDPLTSCYFTDCSTLIIIYHPGLVQ